MYSPYNTAPSDGFQKTLLHIKEAGLSTKDSWSYEEIDFGISGVLVIDI